MLQDAGRLSLRPQPGLAPFSQSRNGPCLKISIPQLTITGTSSSCSTCSTCCHRCGSVPNAQCANAPALRSGAARSLFQAPSAHLLQLRHAPGRICLSGPSLPLSCLCQSLETDWCICLVHTHVLLPCVLIWPARVTVFGLLVCCEMLLCLLYHEVLCKC